ncbi:MAG TPA: hypothetical protein V6D05_16780 [Stenomitos sp.]
MPTAVSTYGAEITFSPKWWNYVVSTRIMVSSFCNVALGNEDIADKITMTAQELLENAVKYTSDQEQDVAVRFTVHEGESITLEVTNTASAESIETLQAQHAEISDGDPLMAYLQKMQRIAMNPGTELSQLGLARIRYETGNDLQLRVDGNRVTMRVVFDITKVA